jgi:hypothetical protein
MYLAICFAVAVSIIGIVFLRPKKCVKMKKFGIGFEKVNAEIAIFNKMRLNLKTTRRQPDLYIKWLGRLHKNPKTRFTENDAIEKFFYIYACAKLSCASHDPNKSRQYYKNIIFAFGQKNAIRYKFWAHVVRGLKLKKHKTLYAMAQPRMKYMETKIVPRNENMRFSHSYIIEKHGGAEVKNYTAQGIEFYEINGEHRFEYDFNIDKMLCTFSHTADTFFCVTTGGVVAVSVFNMPRVNFETSLAAEKQSMCVYINVPKSGLNVPKICIFRGENRAKSVQILQKIRAQNAEIPYLLSPAEKSRNSSLNALVARANSSAYIQGEKLKNRLQSICGLLPTIHLPTLVFDITDADEFFAVLDHFENFKLLARAGMNFNVAIMYSSQNDIVREYIAAYTNRRAANELVAMGIFIFFIDKIRASTDAIYYVSKMLETNSVGTPSGGSGGNAPKMIISRKAVSYATTDMKTGVTKYHRISPAFTVLDEFGAPIPVGFDAVVSAVKIAAAPKKCKKTAANILSRGIQTTKTLDTKRKTC